MKFNNPYFRPIDKIELLQKWILVHSYLYYQLDYSVVEDYIYDNNCKQLMALKRKYPKSWKKAKYSYAFKEFDGSTGMDLFYKLDVVDLSKIKLVAYYLRDNFKGEY